MMYKVALPLYPMRYTWRNFPYSSLDVCGDISYISHEMYMEALPIYPVRFTRRHLPYS